MFELDTTPLYCLHILSQKDREANMYESLDYFRPNKDYTIFPGELIHPTNDGVSRSFKSIIRDAKKKKHSRIIVFEDDIKFTSERSKPHMQEAINTLPDDWDILLGCSYGFKGVTYNEYLEKVEKFSSFICVIFRDTVYDKILEHDIKENKHIDSYISTMCDELNVYITHPFVCRQVDNSYSNTKLKIVDYSSNIKDYKILK